MIRENVEGKIAIWGPQFQEDGPRSPSEIIFPQVFDGPALSVDGEMINVIKAEGLSSRRYLRAPSLEAVFGGVLVFSGIHVWTADTPTKEQRAAWVANLDLIAALEPKIVVPGHMAPWAATDPSGVEYTKGYLRAFEDELATASDAAALKAAIQARHPGLEMDITIDIGSKVAKGEMSWS
ncbi:hypothetical protein [Labrys sp. 22185]|uniref:hypothetical protein n=1 Tax=Labrys sp. 22185 TaxID=3453888 RepID=UPI003F8736CE